MDEDCIIIDDEDEAKLLDEDDDEPMIVDEPGTDIANFEDSEELNMADMLVVDEIKEELTNTTDDASNEKLTSTIDTEQQKEEQEKTEPNQIEAPSKIEKEKDDKEKSTTDVYAYVNQGGFTSEKFKIEIRGLPKFFGIGELKRLLNDSLKLEANKIKPPRSGSHLFVCFRSEEGKQKALDTLNGYVWKNSKLTALTAKPAPDPLVRKRRMEAEERGKGSKTAKPETDWKEKLRSNTVPYSDVPYNTQLEMKTTAMKKILRQLAYQIAKVNPEARGWIKQQQDKYNGLPCELKTIRPSPVLDGYRNKCEFSIGLHPDTELPSIGFRMGSYVSGDLSVYPADDLRHIPDKMKKLAKAFEQLVVSSPLPPWHPEKRTGVWQTLVLRLMRTGQLMVIVQVNLEHASMEDKKQLKQDILLFFTEGAGKAFNVDSLYLQSGQRSKGQSAELPELLHGAPYITEELMGVKLRISPQAFFQVNTAATEELYLAVTELVSPSPDTTLLDICCGTGSIGLCLAKDCGQVLGVEAVKAAVEDAKSNASVNDLSHCDFFSGTAENILGSVIARASRPNFVAVLDPPRPGVGPKVIATIRKCQQINRLVYMACSPSSVLNNFRDLTRRASKSLVGWPFLPVCAIPVDLFPHTPHCELLVLFDRIDPAKLPPLPPYSREEADRMNKNINGKQNEKKNDSKNGKPVAEIDLTGEQKSTTGDKLRQTKNTPCVSKQLKQSRTSQRNFRQRSDFLANYWEDSNKLRGHGRGLGPMRAHYQEYRPGTTQNSMSRGSSNQEIACIDSSQRQGRVTALNTGMSSSRGRGRGFKEQERGPQVVRKKHWSDEIRDPHAAEKIRAKYNRQRTEKERIERFQNTTVSSFRLNEEALRKQQRSHSLENRSRQNVYQGDRREQRPPLLKNPRPNVYQEEAMIPASMVSQLLEKCRRDAREEAMQQARILPNTEYDKFKIENNQNGKDYKKPDLRSDLQRKRDPVWANVRRSDTNSHLKESGQSMPFTDMRNSQSNFFPMSDEGPMQHRNSVQEQSLRQHRGGSMQHRAFIQEQSAQQHQVSIEGQSFLQHQGPLQRRGPVQEEASLQDRNPTQKQGILQHQRFIQEPLERRGPVQEGAILQNRGSIQEQDLLHQRLVQEPLQRRDSLQEQGLVQRLVQEPFREPLQEQALIQHQRLIQERFQRQGPIQEEASLQRRGTVQEQGFLQHGHLIQEPLQRRSSILEEVSIQKRAAVQEQGHQQHLIRESLQRSGPIQEPLLRPGPIQEKSSLQQRAALQLTGRDQLHHQKNESYSDVDVLHRFERRDQISDTNRRPVELLWEREPEESGSHAINEFGCEPLYQSKPSSPKPLKSILRKSKPEQNTGSLSHRNQDFNVGASTSLLGRFDARDRENPSGQEKWQFNEHHTVTSNWSQTQNRFGNNATSVVEWPAQTTTNRFEQQNPKRFADVAPSAKAAEQLSQNRFEGVTTRNTEWTAQKTSSRFEGNIAPNAEWHRNQSPSANKFEEYNLKNLNDNIGNNAQWSQIKPNRFDDTIPPMAKKSAQSDLNRFDQQGPRRFDEDFSRNKLEQQTPRFDVDLPRKDDQQTPKRFDKDFLSTRFDKQTPSRYNEEFLSAQLKKNAPERFDEDFSRTGRIEQRSFNRFDDNIASDKIWQQHQTSDRQEKSDFKTNWSERNKPSVFGAVVGSQSTQMWSSVPSSSSSGQQNSSSSGQQNFNRGNTSGRAHQLNRARSGFWGNAGNNRWPQQKATVINDNKYEANKGQQWSGQQNFARMNNSQQYGSKQQKGKGGRQRW